MTITIADGRGALWQWDTGRRLRVGSGVEQIHYQNRALGCSVDVDVGTDGTAIIPDELLQDCHTLTAYVYVTDDTGAYTMEQQDFIVHKRAKPAGYVYTPTDQMTLQTIQRQIGDLADLTTEAKENLVAAINEAAASGGAGSMALRVADGYIQYSTDSGSTWQNLIAVAELKGADGSKGDPGIAGQDGHSPVVTATKSGKTTTISVDGAAIATVEDGADGKPGAAGADGITPTIGPNGNWYLGPTDTGKPSRGEKGGKGDPGTPGAAGHTPVKGTDYWTASDKAEVVAEAAAAVDLTPYAKKTEVPTKTSQLTNDSGFLTSHQDISGKQDKATLEADVSAAGFTKNTGTYSKPTGGIPKADLAEAVQTSLSKADTALQSHQSLAAYRTAAAQDEIDSGKVDKVAGKGLSTNDYNATEKSNNASNTSARHSHSNKELLDGIDAAKISLWDSGAQQTPLFANSTADCTDTTKVYVLPDGYIYGYINGAWTNTGHQFTNNESLEKVIDATCDIETISGGNYNLLKVNEVSFSSRLQDNVAGIVASTATNIVTGWIPVRQGKYYAVSALVDGIKDAEAGLDRNFVQRINVKKSDGTILVYNKYPTELRTELSRGKAYSVPADATHMMFHIQIQDRIPQSLDISTSAKLKAFEPMIVEGDTAALAVSNSIDFEYLDGDVDAPAIVNYTLKHDPTKQDKVTVSPYCRNVDYHMIPTAYYKGVGTDYDTTFGQNTSYTTFITAWKTLINGHGGYVTETELGNASDNQKIYLYDFKPSRITNQRTNMPKIVIVACQHGTEKSNVYGLYYFVNNLLNKWNESPVLEYLRNHVEIMIIPVLNTYGFDHFSYKNANGVNLNRNYDANWVLLADTNSDQYGGAAPFDQPETQIVRDLLLDNDDASLVVDFHTNGNSAVAQYSYINYYGVSPNSDAYFNRLIDAVAHQLASISANFNLDYSLNQPDTVFGWLNNANGVGLLRDWATENNFAGVLVEGFNGFPNGTPFIGNVYKANEEIIANWLVTALNYLKG